MKNLIIGALIGIIIGMLGTAYASSISDNKKITIYTDEETKIQYIIVESWNSDGMYGVGICPRYTSSGNLYYVGSEIVEKQDDEYDGRKQKMYSLQ